MRNIKPTLLLGGLIIGLVFVISLGGWIMQLEELWKVLLRVTPHYGLVSNLIQITLVFFFSFLTIQVGLEVGTHRERFILFLITALLMISGSLVISLYHYFWNPFPSELALLGGYIMVLFFLRTALGSRQQDLRRIFHHRLQRRLINKLSEKEFSVSFLGELKNGSILVCTLSNHTELMEALNPEAYVAMTNLYLQVASNFLVDVGGYLEECSGESIRVIFGVPLSIGEPLNHSAKAIRAALDLVKRLDELNGECDARWQQRLDFRIGIHSGEMIAALYGGARLSQYSVAGPVVEFAHFLCAACMSYGCRILVGPKTYVMAEATAEFRPIDLLVGQGDRRHVELYEVLAPKNNLSIERERSRDLFWQGVLFFRSQEWEKAVESFQSARILGIPDAALDLYLERIDRTQRGYDSITKEKSILTEALSLLSK
jgi:adenylate cyclase